MGNWRQFADRMKSANTVEDNRDNRDNSPSETPNVPNVPSVPLDAGRALRLWKRGLAKVDPLHPAPGYDAGAWQALCDDAVWVLGCFGEQAARDGWCASDLFGLWPGKPHWGGIADRLRGSRSLVMTADRAHWRSWGVVDRYSRGSYPDLRPMWEIN